MKLCIIIHSLLHKDTENKLAYIRQRLKEGATIVHFSMSSSDYAEFKQMLPQKGISVNNIAGILPKGKNLQYKDFAGYSENFNSFLNSLKPGRNERIEVELTGVADSICFRGLSPPIVQTITKKFGKDKVIAHTFLSEVYGFRNIVADINSWNIFIAICYM